MTRGPRTAALRAPLAVAAAVAAGSAIVVAADPTTPGGPLPPCPTYALFGVLCPGCGGLRMAYSLLHGDVGAAVQYNALALVVVLGAAVLWAGWLRARWRGRPARVVLHRRWVPVAFGIVVLAWGIARNVPVEPFTALRV